MKTSRAVTSTEKKIFSRDRKLKFEQLIILLSKGMVKLVQRELNTFFKEVSAADYDIYPLTSSAFTQSRAKLRPEAFIEMNDSVVRDFYEQAPYDTWKGHRLLSVDGSTIHLPSHKSVAW